MSTLEVLQSFPTQWKSLLSAISGIDPADAIFLAFDLENFFPQLSHYIALIIQVIINGLDIH